ncbi:hypothetical protein BY458DRAFT_492197 [Sporodiniella umbellata]|nr:hypothetical protein BY458DRAFT_492197 [Sporodiniella umbellata]
MGEHKKNSKKFAVGDVAPLPSTSTGNSNKKQNSNSTRHHVKRRPNGRAMSSKLVPTLLAKDEKPMKRSHSNKSLNRLSLMQGEEKTTSQEITQEDNTTQKGHLRSQFVDPAGSSHSGKLRTQQKLLLQREQSSIQDENSPSHPKNMIRLTREIEKMGKEYRCVRKYRDPMMDSLLRCQNRMPAPSSILEQRKLAVFGHSHPPETAATMSADNRWSTFLERLLYGPTYHST